MRVRRSRLTADFVQVPNRTARDDRLSYMARGILAELLSRPDGWEATADDLWRHASQVRSARGESRRDFRDAFAELKAAGYLISSREQLDGGHFGTILTVYDIPKTDVPTVGTSVRAGETPKDAGRTDVPHAGTSAVLTDVPTVGTSVRPGQMGVSPGGADVPTVGIPARPGQIHVSAARTDVPPVGTSNKKTGLKDGEENVSLSATERKIVDAVGATPEEAREIISLIKDRKAPENLGGYINAIISNEDMPGWLARVRAGERAHDARKPSVPAPQSWSALMALPVCGHGEPGGNQIQPGVGTAKCPQCRHGVPAYVQPAPTADDPPPVKPRPPLLAPQTSRGMASAFPPAPAPEATPASPLIQPQPEAAPVPAPNPVDEEKAEKARNYLNQRGDFFEWVAMARKKLGNDAPGGAVAILAAELAKAS